MPSVQVMHNGRPYGVQIIDWMWDEAGRLTHQRVRIITPVNETTGRGGLQYKRVYAEPFPTHESALSDFITTRKRGGSWDKDI